MTKWSLDDGVYVALVTPIRQGRDIDLDALDALIDRVTITGVRGLSPAGTTGEGPRLSRKQRVRLTSVCAQRVPSDIGILSGTFFNTVVEGREELRELAEHGAAAALVCPPVRMPLDQSGCTRYFLELADDSPLPIVIYNIPSMTNNTVPVASVLEVWDHPSIVGIKDSSRDLEYLSLIVDGLRQRGSTDSDFAVLTGTDTLLVPSMVAGAHGTLAASVNLVPELATAIFAAVRDGRMDDANREQARLRKIVEAVRRMPTPAGWKAALEVVGVCSRDLVAPATPTGDTDLESLRRALAEAGIVA